MTTIDCPEITKVIMRNTLKLIGLKIKCAVR